MQDDIIKKLDTPEEISKDKATIDNILVPTDGSGQAFKALLQAIDIAEAWGANITLMMCVKIEDDISAFEKVSLSGYIPSELKNTAYEFLSKLRQVVPNEIDVKIIAEVGEPAEEIVNEITKGNYDIVVMGAHGFGGFGDENSSGSVSKYVQENSPKPVILVKGMPNDWDEYNNFRGVQNSWRERDE
ncbi:MAG: universal stress protein [Selenomonadaceae bacterium]|nr:universal stress protein [Selenomonadaceae bacterium]